MVRVLIAEDESIARRGLVENVDWNGNDIELTAAAENGMEAYLMAQEFAPDIIVTDICMPVMNGLELIEKLRKEMPSIRYIILSAHEEFAWAQQAIRFGVDNYVVKPVDDAELIKTVKAVYCKTEKIQREMFQKNIDYLLLKNDCLFMDRYQQLEDQLVLALRFFQIPEMEEILDEIYAMFSGKQNSTGTPDADSTIHYYRSVCIRQFVRFRESLSTKGGNDIFMGIESVIENELLPLDNSAAILSWYRRKLREYANVFVVHNQSRAERVVEQAEEYIRQNYALNIALNDVSAEVFVSPQYLSRIFHNEKGISFIEYLNRYRIDRAKELLYQKSIPITEVAFQAGYNDYKYFSNVFKKYTGLTPRDFRKEHS
ncbi:MAG: response regulator [Treponema sp.]|jgi:two-component system response regulator YesN|nr:response regulator [Treponema sp.]